MRGPPGSRAPRFLPPREGEPGGSPGAPSSSSGGASSSGGGGGGGSGARPKKASRLLLYLRLRQRELLRLVVLVGSSLLLLLLVVWLLVAFSDGTEGGGGGEANQSAEEVKLNGGLVPPHRRSRFRRRGTGRHFFSRHPRRTPGGGGGGGEGQAGEGEGEDSGEAAHPLMPLVRSPFAAHPLAAQGVSTGLMAGQGTDVYESYRDGEILGRWDRELGLEVDVWDPRTHDPNHPGGGSLGQVVSMQSQAKRGGQGQGASGGAKGSGEKAHYLTVVTFNRLFPEDISNISAYECIQWVEYYRYAGASHVVWYDTSPDQVNPVFTAMAPYIDSGFVTYLRFTALFPGSGESDMNDEQDKSTIHALQTFGPGTTWLAALDVDEYVAAPGDAKPGFLERYLRVYQGLNPDTSQLLLQSFLFIGAPEAPLPALLIEQHTARSAESEGVSLHPESMMKPLVRPDLVRMLYWKAPQHLEMSGGKTMAVPAGALRINHYWGPRLPAYEFREKLVKDESMKPIAVEIAALLSKRYKRGVWSRKLGRVR